MASSTFFENANQTMVPLLAPFSHGIAGRAVEFEQGAVTFLREICLGRGLGRNFVV
jgi:hypothetical protein